MADCSVLDENQLMEHQRFDEQTKSILDILNDDIGPFPVYTINLLKFLGYDNFMALKDFDEKDIKDIEVFAQGELIHLIENQTKENLRQFYGVYCMDPKRFHFLPGHRKLLLVIKFYLTEKGRDYFLTKRTELNRQSPTMGSMDESQDYQNLYRTNDEVDIEFYDGHDSNDEMPEFKRPRILSKTQQLSYHNFIAAEHEHHIRNLVNKWMRASVSKFIKGTVIDNIEEYSIIFHHRPEEGKLTASLQCCICKNNIGVSSQLRKSGSFRWLISNYMRHVKKLHFERDINVPSEMNSTFQPAIKLELDEEQIRKYN